MQMCGIATEYISARQTDRLQASDAKQDCDDRVTAITTIVTDARAAIANGAKLTHSI